MTPSRWSRFIAGSTAPPGKRMGHAGAIISGRKRHGRREIKALGEAGIPVAKSPADMGVTLLEVMVERGMLDASVLG